MAQTRAVIRARASEERRVKIAQERQREDRRMSDENAGVLRRSWVKVKRSLQDAYEWTRANPWKMLMYLAMGLVIGGLTAAAMLVPPVFFGFALVGAIGGFIFAGGAIYSDFKSKSVSKSASAVMGFLAGASLCIFCVIFPPFGVAIGIGVMAAAVGLLIGKIGGRYDSRTPQGGNVRDAAGQDAPNDQPPSSDTRIYVSSRNNQQQERKNDSNLRTFADLQSDSFAFSSSIGSSSNSSAAHHPHSSSPSSSGKFKPFTGAGHRLDGKPMPKDEKMEQNQNNRP